MTCTRSRTLVQQATSPWRTTSRVLRYRGPGTTLVISPCSSHRQSRYSGYISQPWTTRRFSALLDFFFLFQYILAYWLQLFADVDLQSYSRPIDPFLCHLSFKERNSRDKNYPKDNWAINCLFVFKASYFNKNNWNIVWIGYVSNHALQYDRSE